MARVTSVHLSDELAGQLDHLATALDRPHSWLIEQALARYVAEESSQIAAIREALADYQSGSAELVPHEDVVKRLDAQIAAKLGTQE